jgi:hypothetical protein
MDILIDYDNILPLTTKRGIGYIVEKIGSLLDPTEVSNETHINIRLYGGWNEDLKITRRAQILAANISTMFPKMVRVGPVTSKKTLTANAVLAFTLLEFPGEIIENTFRQRGFPKGIRTKHPLSCGCSSPTCPLIAVHEFITQGHITEQTCCTLGPEDLLFKDEQKLVDTMISTDLVFLAQNGSSPIVIVSSDDDLWPAMRVSINSGAKIIQLHTNSEHSIKSTYARRVIQSFTERNWI